MRKVIITAAITGAVYTPSMSPYIPITPDEIVENTVKAWEAGAAVAHIHARDPETGEPNTRVDLFREVASKIKERCDIVLGFTTGGGLGISVQDRVRVAPELKPEVCSFNAGSMNFGLFKMLEKHKEFKYSWEKGYLENTRDFVFKNTFKDMECLADTMAEYGTKPELEIFDVGMISNCQWLMNQGLLQKPLLLQFVLGIMGGIPASVENLIFMWRTARDLLGDFDFAAIGPARIQMAMQATSVALGGNIRVGLEDSLYIDKGQLAKSCAEQVEKAVHLVKGFGFQVATSDDVRERWRLKGIDKVNY